MNGRVAANFSVAVDESYKDLLGEWHKKTEWHRVKREARNSGEFITESSAELQ